VGKKLEPHLPELVDFVLESKFTEHSVDALKSLVINSQTDELMTLRIVSHLLDWNDLYPVLQTIADILDARNNICIRSMGLARLCISRIRRQDPTLPIDFDDPCVRILRKLQDNVIVKSMTATRELPQLSNPARTAGSRAPVSKSAGRGSRADSKKGLGLNDIVAECQRIGDISSSFSEFRRLCIANSPDEMIRACERVADQYATVRHNLFNLAFYSYGTSQYSGDLRDLLKGWLAATANPSVVVATTELIEFMDRTGRYVLDLSFSPSLASQLRVALLDYDGSPDKVGNLVSAYRNLGMFAEAQDLDSNQDNFTVRPSPLYKEIGIPETSDTNILFKELGERFGPRFEQGFTAVLSSLSLAEQIIESEEGLSTNCVTRLRNCSSLFHEARAVLLRRIQHIKSADEEKQLLLHLAAVSHEWHAFKTDTDTFFGRIQESVDSAGYYWERFEQKNAFAMLTTLISQTPDNHVLRAFYLRCAVRLMKTNEVKTAVAPECVHPDCLVAWAWSNYHLNKLGEAMLGFADVINRCSNWRLSDILRVLNIAFHRDHVEVIDEGTVRKALNRIPNSHFLKVLNHLLVKAQDLPSSRRPIYEDLIVGLITQFPYGVVFSIQCWKKSTSQLVQSEDSSAVPFIRNIVKTYQHQAFKEAAAIRKLFWAVAFPLQLRLYSVMGTLCNNIADFDGAADDARKDQLFKRFSLNRERLAKKLGKFPGSGKPDAELESLLDTVTDFCSKMTLADLARDTDGFRRVYGRIRTYLNDHRPPQQELAGLALPNFDYKHGIFNRLPVFGHYSPDSVSQIGIQELPASMEVMPSLQRPCKLDLVGTNGVVYRFLLKANEDLRRDERLMQFFQLLNQILGSKIRTYSITPLDSYVGVLEWVRRAPTFQQLVRLGLRLSDADWLDHMEQFQRAQTKNRKEEVLKGLQGVYRGAIRDALWILARNSERWLLYQNTFAKSLAVMSMVGQLIGLGDRHLGNLLFEKHTGIAIHIDFGFIFDEARTGQANKELVPFRATVALGVACGPRGFDGVFRRECERALGAMGQNRESVLSGLEIFGLEPVIPMRSSALGKRTQSKMNEDKADAEKKMAALQNKLPNAQKPPSELVNDLICEATEVSNLAKMYKGWQPFI
jgi:hypothetical protein